MEKKVAIFWHRRDLRMVDNAGLHKALRSELKVQAIFIFDRSILDRLSNKRDTRVLFIYQEIERLRKEYAQRGAELRVYHGVPEEIWPEIIQQYSVEKVFFNRDYEPYALKRDKAISAFLKEQGIDCIGAKDHVIFEKEEVTKDDGTPYTVFTPYMKKWKSRLAEHPASGYHSIPDREQLLQTNEHSMIGLEEMGFEAFEFEFPSRKIDNEVLEHYGERRDIPAVRGTTQISMHLRFGTVSIRSLLNRALQHSEKWLNELIWRDFYQMIIYHFPNSVNQSFKPKYDQIPWINDEKQFERWCEGKTGYPIVDAGMRQLNATGFMHNRVRMIVASFLTKHLLIDWRWGERYFAEKLLDFELASNVGGWQWAASSGCDAAPYFRVFNPSSQESKFDPDRKYIRRWVPEVDSSSYPSPIVEHKMARQRAIDTYKQALTEA